MEWKATSVNGSSLELRLNCTGTPTTATATTITSSAIVGLRILARADQSEYTTVGFNYTSRRLFVDHTHSGSLASTIVQTAPLAPLAVGTKTNTATAGASTSDTVDSVELYVLVDRALVESFVNGRAALSSWVTEVMAR